MSHNIDINKKILVTGGSGALGSEIRKLVKCFTPSSKELDITDLESCGRGIKKYNPDIIIHCAAWTDVAGAEKQKEKCWQINVVGTENMIRAAGGRRFIYISTEYVFDGEKGGYTSPEEEKVYKERGLAMLERFWQNEHFKTTDLFPIPNFPKAELGNDLILTGKLDWLEKDDQLISALVTEKGDEIMIATAQGQSIRFKESDVREMGRTAGGVSGIRLSKTDEVIGVDVVKKTTEKGAFLTMSANGFGKKTNLKEYKVQKRGGSGVKTAKVTSKTGKLIVAKVLTGEEIELIAMSKKGQVIRTTLKDISSLGRQTQGVTIMRLRAGDGIASLACI